MTDHDFHLLLQVIFLILRDCFAVPPGTPERFLELGGSFLPDRERPESRCFVVPPRKR
jgi:hypothetical protein